MFPEEVKWPWSFGIWVMSLIMQVLLAVVSKLILGHVRLVWLHIIFLV